MSKKNNSRVDFNFFEPLKNLMVVNDFFTTTDSFGMFTMLTNKTCCNSVWYVVRKKIFLWDLTR